MSLRTCTRRFQRPAAFLIRSRTTASPLSRLLVQRSMSSSPSSRAAKEPEPEYTNPIIQDYLTKRPKHLPSQRAEPPKGDLGSDSIFGGAPAPEESDAKKTEAAPAADGDVPLHKRNPEYMRMALDPDPTSRRRWERKMVIRSIHKRGRLSKAEIIKRTERESQSKSVFYKTSLKKMTKLAHQVAGKPIDEAILQMRFSKKKAAQDVKAFLEHAKNEAIAKRGMGLGKTLGIESKPVEIELKDGKRKVVHDPSNIYVDQAWVGRGTPGRELEYRARGRVNILTKQFTSISVVLKEEATRIRLNKERQEKRNNRKLWTQLPNRPITAQHQYGLW